ncbi:MAG: type II secretion system protein [Patescibacteria group bacterium]
MKNTAHKGFTLIELLVVIAIIAILSVVVILTLNPAELLRQARDSNRISDLNTVKSALSLYLADVSIPVLVSSTQTNAGFVCYLDAPSPSTTTCPWFPTIPNPLVNSTATVAAAVARRIDGNGWIPVNLTVISSGAPVGNLPTDPINNSAYLYSYTASSTSLTFKLAANMESTKYGTAASPDEVETRDGGTSAGMYEVGTNLSL